MKITKEQIDKLRKILVIGICSKCNSEQLINKEKLCINCFIKEKLKGSA
jgi:hypothetical protein